MSVNQAAAKILRLTQIIKNEVFQLKLDLNMFFFSFYKSASKK